MSVESRKNRIISILYVVATVALTGCNSESAPLGESELTEGREITSSQSEGSETEETTIPETATATGPATPAAQGPGSITDMILITGQSNALGSETAFDPTLDQPVDHFYAYTDQGWRKADLRQVWDLGTHPAMGLGDDPHNNFGFHFGKSVVAKQKNRVVGIVLVTAPGEGITHWDADNYFFNKIRNKALAALNELPHKSSFDGILWHQGETDWGINGSMDPELVDWQLDSNYYSNKLWTLIDNFRNETWFDHGKPFICGETARAPINARLMSLNRNADSWTACVEGEGLGTWDEEQVHFSAEGLRTLGSNYAERYLEMTGN